MNYLSKGDMYKSRYQIDSTLVTKVRQIDSRVRERDREEGGGHVIYHAKY